MTMASANMGQVLISAETIGLIILDFNLKHRPCLEKSKNHINQFRLKPGCQIDNKNYAWEHQDA